MDHNNNSNGTENDLSKNLRLEWVEAGSLTPNPSRWRKHPEKQKTALSELINNPEIGWAGVLLYNEQTGRLIDGHARAEIAEPTQPVPVLIGSWSEDAERKILVTLDRTTELAETDDEILLELLNSVEFETPALDSLASDLLDMLNDQLTEGETEPDAVPPVPETPISQPGFIYQLGDHRLLVADSTDPAAVAKLLAGDKADLLLTDPPYNVAYQGKTADALTIQNDSMDDKKFRQFLIDAFSAAAPVLKPGAVFYIWHADSEGLNFRIACHEAGWKVRQCLIWKKDHFVLGRQDYHWQHEPCLYGCADGAGHNDYQTQHEPCLYGWADGAAHQWLSDRKQTTVLEFARPTCNDDHPTMKPCDLFAYQITNSAKCGQIVLDTFAGSGTTVIAAERTARRARVIELDPIYADVIRRRWAEFTHGESCDWQALTPEI